MRNILPGRLSLLVFFVCVALFLGACSIISRIPYRNEPAGTQSENASRANGESIYFTATNIRGERIPYTGGPAFGGMMMGSYLTCAACHGPEARGGVHVMHMQVMDAPDIRFAALSAEAGEHTGGEGEEHTEGNGEYNLEDFRLAVVEGKHPDGAPLSRNMPRWQISDEDLSDLLAFLKAIP